MDSEAGPGEFQQIVEHVGKAVDAIGVAVIVLGIVWVAVAFGFRAARGDRSEDSYQRGRHGVGRSILMGLEILVAADIIRTVAIAPTFESVGVLALVVAVRTFLSFTLEVELSGSWPWQKRESGESS